MRPQSLSISVLPFLALSTPALAQVVYDNGAPNFDNGHHSDFDTSSPSDTVQLGDDFTLGVPASFGEVRFWGAYAFDNVPPAADAFTLRVFDLSSPPPPNAPLEQRSFGTLMRTDTGGDIVGFDVYQYVASFAPISLSAGTYLLSIVNDTTGTLSDGFWLTSGSPYDAWDRASDASPWVPHGSSSGAFTLSVGGYTAVCFGDGSGTACPCGNTGTSGAGCANGTGGGGVLTASGTASVTGDTLSLTAEGVINNNGLFFQGNNTIGGGAGTPFGDGIRCCGGSVVRIEVVNPPGSTSPATAQMTETATTNGPGGTINAGDKKCYQFWYRDPASSPCGAQFNLTNAVSVTWQP